jgi:hypothetical protein
MAQVAGYAKGFVAQNQQQGHSEADDHPCYRPVPRLTDEFDERHGDVSFRLIIKGRMGS